MQMHFGPFNVNVYVCVCVCVYVFLGGGLSALVLCLHVCAKLLLQTSVLFVLGLLAIK